MYIQGETNNQKGEMIMKINTGMIIKTSKEITIPIMPPMLFGKLRKNTKYEITKINDNGEVDLMEIAKGCRHQVSIKQEQLETEILANSVCLI